MTAPPRAGDPTVPGSRFASVLAGRFHLMGLIGVGAMGAVYRARDLELGETVALKMLRPELVGSRDMLELFRREVRLARRVTHPNVARIYDIGEHDQVSFLTMQYVEGESLAALLERREPIAIARAIAITRDILAGLWAAHDAGVLHRDLKPGNVLVTPEGRAVVTDFGVARAADSAPDETGGLMVGTPLYMAPEQMEGGALDARADLYAVGVVLFEMLTGQRPIEGKSTMAVATTRLTEPPPDPRTLRPELSEALAKVVLRLMARQPEDRFASAAEATVALATVEADEGLATVRWSAASVVTPPGSAPPRATAAAPDPGQRILVAVLPFTNLGPPGEEYLSDGVTDDVIDGLSRSALLRVRPRGAVMSYRGSDTDPRKAGLALGVHVVVEGSVRRLGERVRVTARLVSVTDGFVLYSARFDRPAGEILQVADEATAAVAEALTAAMPDRTGHRPADPEVVDLYMRARHAFHAFSGSSIVEAIRLLEEALARHPDDPALLAAYALAVARRWIFIQESDPGIDALEVAERAVALAPDLGEPALARAAVLSQLGHIRAAVPDLCRALVAAPHLADAHELLGRLLLEVDRIDQGIERLELAMAIEPHMVRARQECARGHALAGQLDRALAELESIERSPTLTTITMRVRLALWQHDDAALGSLGQAAAALPDLHGFVQQIIARDRFHIEQTAAPEIRAPARATPRLLPPDPGRGRRLPRAVGCGDPRHRAGGRLRAHRHRLARPLPAPGAAAPQARDPAPARHGRDPGRRPAGGDRDRPGSPARRRRRVSASAQSPPPATRGRRTRKRVVPPLRSARTLPPWSDIVRSTIASPRPVPLALVVKNGSKIGAPSDGSPGPLSATTMSMLLPSSDRPRATLPGPGPLAAASMAFSTRL